LASARARGMARLGPVLGDELGEEPGSTLGELLERRWDHARTELELPGIALAVH
jgi:hypothetical protein